MMYNIMDYPHPLPPPLPLYPVPMIFFILLEKLLMLDMNVDRSFFFLSVVGVETPTGEPDGLPEPVTPAAADPAAADPTPPPPP